MLGIAVYPDKTLFEDDAKYLKLAHDYGYQRVFMSMLQIDINDPKKSIRRLKETIKYANELNMLVMLDIHPMVFDYLKLKEDDLIIGNAFASEEELKVVKEIYDDPIDYLNVCFYDDVTALEKQIVCCLHDYRGDASKYMIRSSHNRKNYFKESIKASNTVRDIHRGDILVLNDDYGQYKGEVQIALVDRIGDQRINVVGRIVEEEMILLEQLKPFQKFILKEQ